MLVSVIVSVVLLLMLSSEGEVIGLWVRVCSSVFVSVRFVLIRMVIRFCGKRRFCISVFGSVGVCLGSRVWVVFVLEIGMVE